MPVYKTEAEDFAAAAPLEAGDRFESLPVLASPLGSPHLYVEAEESDVRALRRQGRIRDARPEQVYRPLYVGPWPPPTIERPIGPMSFDNMALSWLDLLEEITPILQAVDYGAGLEEIVVCDTGIKAEHEFWAEIGTELRGELVDVHGHGSFCASEIARLLPKARIRAVRVLNGPNGSGTEHSIVNQLGLLADLQTRDRLPRVANNSWGGGASQGIDDAYRRCLAAGVVMSCAAGNDGPNAHQGSPARVSPLVAGAYDWRTDIITTFSSGGDAWGIITAYLSGYQEWGIGIGGFNHYHQSSGTSMADPFLTAVTAMLRTLHPDWPATAMAEQVRAWAQPLAQPTRNQRGRGWVPLAALGDIVDTHEIEWRLDEIAARIDEAQRLRPEVEVNPEAWGAIYDRELGPIKDLVAQAKAALKKGDGGGSPVPEPEPSPVPVFDSFGGSYPGGHDPAFDLYPNGEYGPHLGHVFRCPVAGTVERYSFASPLDATAAWEVEHEDPSTQEAMSLSGPDSPYWAPLLTDDEQQVIRALGTQMHIAVFRPSAPLTLANGQPCRALWVGHVQPGFQAGARQAGDTLALCGESGIEFPNGSEAAHGHVCGSSDGSLSPNGNVDGAMVALALGYRPRRTPVPGPQDYFSGRYYRGKLR